MVTLLQNSCPQYKYPLKAVIKLWWERVVNVNSKLQSIPEIVPEIRQSYRGNNNNRDNTTHRWQCHHPSSQPRQHPNRQYPDHPNHPDHHHRHHHHSNHPNHHHHHHGQRQQYHQNYDQTNHHNYHSIHSYHHCHHHRFGYVHWYHPLYYQYEFSDLLISFTLQFFIFLPFLDAPWILLTLAVNVPKP